jgi:uncharacterized protein (TIGR04255 family)
MLLAVRMETMTVATLDWLDLEAPPRTVFERTPLALALCQVRYAPMLNVSSPAVVAPFQQAILDDYPIASQEHNVSIHVEGEFGKSQAQASVESGLGSISWRFTDTDDNWTVVLNPEFVTLETRAYRHFSDFLARLDRVLKALAKYIRPTVGARIGLRYINEVRQDELAWSSVIRPELLGTLAVPELAVRTHQSVQQVLFRWPEGDRGVNITHGLLSGGAVVTPRRNGEPPSGPFYLLDFDVYQEFKPGALLVKSGPICERVKQYHDVVSLLFRWSVTEAYAATLGRREDVDD